MSEKELVAIEYYGDNVYLVYKYRGETYKKRLKTGTYKIKTLT